MMCICVYVGSPGPADAEFTSSPRRPLRCVRVIPVVHARDAIRSDRFVRSCISRIRNVGSRVSRCTSLAHQLYSFAHCRWLPRVAAPWTHRMGPARTPPSFLYLLAPSCTFRSGTFKDNFFGRKDFTIFLHSLILRFLWNLFPIILAFPISQNDRLQIFRCASFFFSLASFGSIFTWTHYSPSFAFAARELINIFL